MENLKGTLSRTVTAPQLKKIYEALDDEERPYDATIRTVKLTTPGTECTKKKRLLIMRIRPDDKLYFQNLIQTASNEAKK